MNERKAKQLDRLKRELYPDPAIKHWSDEISTCLPYNRLKSRIDGGA